MDFDRERKQPGGRLKVDVILESIDADDADDLREALADPRESNAHIARTVTKQSDFNLCANAVSLWRERNGIKRNR